jgi:hypothetical protein
MPPNILRGLWIAFAFPAFISGCAGSNDPPSISACIHISVRQSALDSSTAVVQIENLTSEQHRIVINFANYDDHQRKLIALDLPPNESSEIGILEGWALLPNETFEITSPGYRGIRFNTYKTDRGSVGIKQLSEPGRYIPPVKVTS